MTQKSNDEQFIKNVNEPLSLQRRIFEAEVQARRWAAFLADDLSEYCADDIIKILHEKAEEIAERWGLTGLPHPCGTTYEVALGSLISDTYQTENQEWLAAQNQHGVKRMDCSVRNCPKQAVCLQLIAQGQTPNTVVYRVAVCEEHRDPQHESFPLPAKQ